MNSFKDQVVLITGAGKGSGRALAEAFAEQGAIVAANDISPINVDEVVEQIIKRGGQACSYVDDIAKKVAAQALVKRVEDDLGRIDILINHASVAPRSALLDMDEWDWHRTLDVNLTGAFLVTQSVGRIMREQGKGTIIHLITGVSAGFPQERAAFWVSMAGLRTLSQQAKLEFEPHGVHVHAVETGGPDLMERVLDMCRRQA